MLSELQISNFAIIEHQSVTFTPGLNVISGETGAGKSIILHAIELILGGRPKPHMLRDGATSSEVQALFTLHGLPEKVIAELPDIAQGDELVISRVLTPSGRGKVYINGRLGTVALLEEIVSKFVNICGQNQHVRLLDPAFHRELLDGYARNEDILLKYENAFTLWRDASLRLRSLEEAIHKNVTRRAELEFLIQELESIALKPGLRAELDNDLKRLSNSEALIQRVQKTLDTLNDEQGVFTQLHQVSGELHELVRIDPKLGDVAKLFSAARTEIEECERDLRRYGSGIRVDDERLEKVREQLAEVARLERKYRTDDTGLLELLKRSSEELAMIDGSIDLDELREELVVKEEAMNKLAHELTERRKRAGRSLAKEVAKELAELSMAGASLDLQCDTKECAIDGQDALQFLISTNKGEPTKPLRQVASGGELSRVMLVLKKVLKERTGVNVLVFDEVDVGVSGGVARSVGEKLQELSEGSQVICITHLPQVASLADQHLLVEKREVPAKKGERARTISSIRTLSDDERVDEIARMLAGHSITESARGSARELLEGRRA